MRLKLHTVIALFILSFIASGISLLLLAEGNIRAIIVLLPSTFLMGIVFAHIETNRDAYEKEMDELTPPDER